MSVTGISRMVSVGIIADYHRGFNMGNVFDRPLLIGDEQWLYSAGRLGVHSPELPMQWIGTVD